MADRYCRNCGHGLAEDDRFCPDCGSPVHEVAHVPTPEADVPVPPPQQDRSAALLQPENGAPSPGRHGGLGVLARFNRLSRTAKVLIASVPIVSGLLTAAYTLTQLYDKATYEKPAPQLAFVD